MNDIASAKFSLRNRLSFYRVNITGRCAGYNWVHLNHSLEMQRFFSLLIKAQFQDVNPAQYAFIEPIVGAITRPIGDVLAYMQGSGPTAEEQAVRFASKGQPMPLVLQGGSFMIRGRWIDAVRRPAKIILLKLSNIRKHGLEGLRAGVVIMKHEV